MAIKRKAILIPEFDSWESCRQAVTQSIQDLQSQILSGLPIIDYGGERISNVGIPQANNDVVTLGYLRTMIPTLVQNTTSITNLGVATAGLNQKDITSTPYPVLAGDDVLTLKAGASVVNLPALSGISLRKVLYIINLSGGSTTVFPNGADTVGQLGALILPNGAYVQIVPNA